ncbi:MAG: dipeptidase, partial [Candidatus Dormibacteria bacterium]
GPVLWEVHTPALASEIDSRLLGGLPVGETLDQVSRVAKDQLLQGGYSAYWQAWIDSGVTVSSCTMGGLGSRPFSYDAAVADIGLMQALFDGSDRLLKVRSSDDARRAKAEGRNGIILNFQNTTHFDADLSRLETFFELGVRVVQLTYNSRNLVGDGCTERAPQGLTQFGKDVVRKMNELGIVIDLSHCSEPTVLDTLRVSSKPVMMTHIVCAAVHNHDRAKTDSAIRAVAEGAGHVGICVVPFFLTDDRVPSIQHWIRHLEHAVDLAGPTHVGIGTDWGSQPPGSLVAALNQEVLSLGFRAEHQVNWAASVDGFANWSEWPNLTRALVARGFSDGDIRGFLGENFLTVFGAATVA